MKLFSAIWSIWAALIFTLQLCIVTPLYFLVDTFGGNSKRNISHHIGRWWARTYFILTLTKVKVIGQELIDPDRAYVFVTNHRSQLDIPASVLATRNPFRYLGKKELEKIPLLGYITKTLYIVVDRKDKEDRQRSVDEMNNSLQHGTSIFIYPEGTRHKGDGPLGEFYDGAFKLAIENQVPLAVMTMKGTNNLLPSGSLFLKAGVIEAIWDEPIETKGMDLNDLSRLKDMARDKMLSHLAS